MKNKAYNILLAFFWGIGGYTIAYIILESLFYGGVIIIDFVTRYNYILNIQIAVFYGYVLQYLGNSFIEEGIRVLVVKKLNIINPYGLLLGLSWGLIENLYRRPEHMFNAANISHIIDAGIICYFVKKNKPLLGFLIAFMLHTSWNLIGIFI